MITLGYFTASLIIFMGLGANKHKEILNKTHLSCPHFQPNCEKIRVIQNYLNYINTRTLFSSKHYTFINLLLLPAQFVQFIDPNVFVVMSLLYFTGQSFIGWFISTDSFATCGYVVKIVLPFLI